MNKIPKDILDYYLENPEMWEVRKQVLWEELLDYVEEVNMKSHLHTITEMFDRAWKNVKCYWIMLDSEDLKAMVDRVYKENKHQDYAIQ